MLFIWAHPQAREKRAWGRAFRSKSVHPQNPTALRAFHYNPLRKKTRFFIKFHHFKTKIGQTGILFHQNRIPIGQNGTLLHQNPIPFHQKANLFPGY